MIASTKNYTKKERRRKKQTGRTLGQMVKAKVYRQNHRKKHTHTHLGKEKKVKNIYIHIYKKKEESNQINKQIYQ